MILYIYSYIYIYDIVISQYIILDNEGHKVGAQIAIALSSVIIGCLILIIVGLLILFLALYKRKMTTNPTQQV